MPTSARNTAPSDGTAPPSVLVVDDDDDVRESVRDILEDEGYRVLTAANGFEAMRTLHEQPLPKVILLDLMMPVMNGWQFRDAQQLEPQLADIPVVIVTASTHLADAARELTPFGALQKPVSVDELLDLVGSLT